MTTVVVTEQSIPSHYYTCSIPYNITISKTTCYAMQYLASTSFLSSCVIAVSGISQYNPWCFGINIGVILITPFILGYTYSFQKKYPSLSLHSTPLVTDLKENQMQLIHELCEMDIQGEHLECSIERVHEIVSSLTETGSLAVLNSVPSYYLKEDSRPICYTSSVQYTPLHYWASKGNLEVVKLLIKHGACDYCENSTTSALYEAAFFGKTTVVQYLLNYGAHADLPFHMNSLFYFLPRLLFQMMIELEEEYQKNLHCLDLILLSLSKNNPDSLKYQLKIPVDEEGANILSWMKRIEASTFSKECVEMLIKYGASETEGCTLDELHRNGMHTGNGITLAGLASLK